MSRRVHRISVCALAMLMGCDGSSAPWKAPDSAAANLGKPVTIPGFEQYRMQPPAGWILSAEQASTHPLQRETIAHTWVGETLQFPSVSVKQSIDVSISRDAELSTVMRQYANFKSLQFEEDYFRSRPRPVTQDIGGLTFARMFWGGCNDRVGKVRGVIYAAQDGDHTILIGAYGYEVSDFEAMDLATAVTLTFRKRKGEAVNQ